MEYHFDTSGHYTYIMLNATEGELGSVIKNLTMDRIPYISHGPSRRPANNGRQYQWYIRISTSDKQPKEQSIENFFKNNFAVFSERLLWKKMKEEHSQVTLAYKALAIKQDEIEDKFKVKVNELKELRSQLHKSKEENEREYYNKGSFKRC